MNLIERISTLENLMLAWRKLELSFEYGEVWFDVLDLAAFKMNLVDNLMKIRLLLKNNKYIPHPISPIPYPKAKSKNGDLRVRQSFSINIEDQLVWVAICNIIGWRFDKEMPAWSYGNRLFLYMWKQNNEWKFGNYRHSYRRVYKKWNQSWPAMRKRITMSLQCMAKISNDLTEEQQQIIKQENSISTDKYIRLRYLQKGYFQNKTECEKLYWTGLDLEKFYQKVKLKKVIDYIKNTLGLQTDDIFCSLLDNYTTFNINYSDYPSNDDKSISYLQEMQLDQRPDSIDYLPTGLIVAGFLSNVFMLEIDKEIDHRLDENHDIIHFRYVDDHIIISREPEMLYHWIHDYCSLLEEKGLVVNKDKLEPIGAFAIKEDGSWNEMESIQNIKNVASLIPSYPTPLMTQTLTKVSHLSSLNLNLLSKSEFDSVLEDLQSLIVIDIPEQEIKKETRVSFACTMLSRLLVDGDIDYDEIYRLRLKWMDKVNTLDEEDPCYKDKFTLLSLIFNDGELLDLETIKEKYPTFDLTILSDINTCLTHSNKRKEYRNKRVFELLCFAILQAPDKVGIWLKSMSFCSKHYQAGCKKIYDLLIELSLNNEIHQLSFEYLYSILNILTSELIVKAIARRVSNQYKSKQGKDNDDKFLNLITDLPHIKFSHSFVLDSCLLLRKSYSLIKIFNSSNKDLTNNEERLVLFEGVKHNGLFLDATYWIRWCKELTKSRDPKEFQISNIFNVFDEFLEPDSIFYPKKIIQTTIIYSQIDKGWITLRQWIDLINDNNIDKLDVRHSELLSVLILISICDQIDKCLRSGDDVKYLTLDNIIVSNKILYSDSWNFYLKESTSAIEVKFVKDDNMLDNANYNPFFWDETTSVHYALTYALGIVFLQCVTKKSSLPWVMDRPEYGFEWQPTLIKLMESGSISSLNYRIICSCLSLNFRETRMLRNYLGADFVDDTYRMTPDIKTWNDLRRQLKISLECLKSNLISVANEQHRQLIVIDLN